MGLIVTGGNWPNSGTSPWLLAEPLVDLNTTSVLLPSVQDEVIKELGNRRRHQWKRQGFCARGEVGFLGLGTLAGPVGTGLGSDAQHQEGRDSHGTDLTPRCTMMTTEVKKLRTAVPLTSVTVSTVFRMPLSSSFSASEQSVRMCCRGTEAGSAHCHFAHVGEYSPRVSS